ncbi:sugar transferase [Eubacterium ramulus]|uniref:Putative colanic biosynthesis UDP-glucose lipid carrier transferase n=1 Tax=Eubacterium ramulus TaxID=39490 RepID=A0A173UVT4_EUBRA|nr:sugar transferase [Eubacterium ramulus]CUN18217.1 Putative colanic biosynthesis UDP-glucose lipid carrier transferase [Eubacterium ramulus]
MNRKKKLGWWKHIDFMLIDLLCIQIAYLAAYFFRHQTMRIYRETSLYAHVNILLIIIDICYVLLRGTYKNILKRSFVREIESVLVHNIVMWGVVMAYLYVTKQAFWFSRQVFLTSFGFTVIFMLVGRFLWKMNVRRIIWKGKNQPNFLVISTKEYAAEMVKQFSSRMYNGFNLSGLAIMDEKLDDTVIERIPVVCSKDNLLEYVQKNVIDEVMIKMPENRKEVDELTWTLLQMGVVVHIALDYTDHALPNRVVERIGGYTCMTTSINTASSIPMGLKRLTDIMAGLVGCAITGVAFIFVAPLIYKASPGPIFYCQERVGKNGRRFKMYKFRSMYMDAEERKKELMAQNKMQGNMFKMDNDPRIIGSEKGPGKGIGNIIRSLSIDELPQFYNILRGDMSLVGTRPPTVDEVAAYDLHHKVRLSMKPGLTGMWQVSGRSEITDFEEIVRLDAYYIENWSLKLDLKIILKTFKVVFAKEGADSSRTHVRLGA